jgi:two-component system, chemotaxis family, chemotaxis protein CheY
MANYDISKLDIMVVDDSSTMRAILKMILNGLGVTRVRLCNDGVEAFEEFRKVPSDIVITDWVMKTLSGIELVRLLRDPEESPHPGVPIIMITSNAAQDEVLKAHEAGVDAYLAKPVTPETVYKRISQVIHNQILANDDDGLVNPELREKGGAIRGSNDR